MNKITIAIDGFSSTGKSTIAKELAKKLAYSYVDSGAMYRAVALYAIQHKLIDDNVLNTEKLIESLTHIKVAFQYNNSLKASEIYLNDVNVNTEIRSMIVSNAVSIVASVPEVRKQLVALQQQMGAKKGIVMDGRDIGTVVFPNAELKLFVTADPLVRAKRRFIELQATQPSITMEEVAENLSHRDLMDSTRTHSPLKQAEDAMVLDNTNLDRAQQFELAMQWAMERIN